MECVPDKVFPCLISSTIRRLPGIKYNLPMALSAQGLLDGFCAVSSPSNTKKHFMLAPTSTHWHLL